MKVTLLQTVKGLGVRGDTREVKAGYALNFLLRQGLAVAGDTLVPDKKHSAIRARGAKTALQRQLSAKTLTTEALVHDTSTLYGSIGAEDVILAAQQQLGVTLAKKQITKGLPIRALGTHELELTIEGQSFPITIKVKGIYGQKK